jgi:hypothetical protein
MELDDQTIDSQTQVVLKVLEGEGCDLGKLV